MLKIPFFYQNMFEKLIKHQLEIKFCAILAHVVRHHAF